MTQISPQEEHRADPYAAWRIRDYRYYGGCFLLLILGSQIENVAIGVEI